MPRLTTWCEYETCPTPTLRDLRSRLSRKVRYRPGLAEQQAKLKAVTTELLKREMTAHDAPKPHIEPLGDAGAAGSHLQARLPYKD